MNQTYLCQGSVPVSRQMIEDPGAKHALDNILTTHFDQLLLESIQQRFPDRYFVAHVYSEEMGRDMWGLTRNIIYFTRKWMITLH